MSEILLNNEKAFVSVNMILSPSQKKNALFFFEFQIISRFLRVKSHDSVLLIHFNKMSKGFYLDLAIIMFVLEGINLTPISTNLPCNR